MSRSKWKGPYVKKKDDGKRLILKRSSEILPNLIGKTVWSHSGKSFTKVDLSNNEMVGHKIGEFVPTRADFSFKKKKGKK